MADITMCFGKDDKGQDCVLRNDCYRFTAPENPHWQAYFVESPWFNNNCEMYYGTISGKKRNGIEVPPSEDGGMLG